MYIFETLFGLDLSMKNWNALIRYPESKWLIGKTFLLVAAVAFANWSKIKTDIKFKRIGFNR